jgi:two-component sensor histidine kinase
MQAETYTLPARSASDLGGTRAGGDGTAGWNPNGRLEQSARASVWKWLDRSTAAGRVTSEEDVASMRPFRQLLPARFGGKIGPALTACVVALSRRAGARLRGRSPAAGEPSLADVAENLPGLIYRHVLHADGSASYPFLAGRLPGVALDAGDAPASTEVLMRHIGAAQAAAWRPAAEAGSTAPFRLELPVGGRWLRSVARLRHRRAGTAGAARMVWDGVVLDVTDLKQAEARLAASVVEKEALLGEIHHRVYNNLQVVLSLLRLEARDARDEETRERLDRVANMIAVLGRIHRQLDASRDFGRIDVAAELRRIVGTLALEAARAPFPVEAVPLHCDVDTAVPFLLAACELVAAAQRAVPDATRGTASIHLARAAEGEVRLTVHAAGMLARSLSALGRSLVEALCMQIGAVAEFRVDGGNGGEVASVAVPGQRFVD